VVSAFWKLCLIFFTTGLPGGNLVEHGANVIFSEINLATKAQGAQRKLRFLFCAQRQLNTFMLK